MTPEALRAHPAYLALSPEEQRAVDERLGDHHLDALAVAADTGEVDALEASDLRRWLAVSRARPWAQVSLCPQPERADLVFEALLKAAPRIDSHPDRPALVDQARGFSRAVAAAEAAHLDAGFVREEELAGLLLMMESLGEALRGWTEEAVLGALEAARMPELSAALSAYKAQTSGLRGLVRRWSARRETRRFNLAHGGAYLLHGDAEHEGRFEDGVWRNWTANYSASPRRFLTPSDEAELCEAVAGAERLRVVGGGHSFNASPLSDDTLISLDEYDRLLELDVEEMTARVQGGVRLRDLNRVLERAGLGLPVLGSTDAQSIAGLVCTDLHGTGRDRGFLSEQVLSLRIIAADGQARTARPGEPLFHAALGGLGVCGVVAEVELQLVPTFRLAKTTKMVDRFDSEREISRLVASCEHLSFYYVGGAERSEAIRAHRWARTDAPLSPDWEAKKTRTELTDFSLASFAPGVVDLVSDIDEDSWLSNALAPDERLVMPGGRAFGRKLFYRHDELEFGVPMAAYGDCLHEITALLRQRDFFSIIETRFTPDRSQALLGPGVGRQTAYIELATPLSQERGEVFAQAEEILRAYGGQPHLGKKTNINAQGMLETYGARFERFQAVRAAQDPHDKLLNAFTRRVFGG